MRSLLFHTRQERQGGAGPGLATRPDASPAFGERGPVPLGESEGLISCPSVCWWLVVIVFSCGDALKRSFVHLARACPLRAQDDVKLEGEFVT